MGESYDPDVYTGTTRATNWEDGLQKIIDLGIPPDLVIFLYGWQPDSLY